MAERDEGLIYYMLDADRHALRIKIGTTCSLNLRLDSVREQTKHRQRPLLLAVEEGGYHLERQLHDRFAPLRLTGEWFRYEGDLREYIATLDNPYAYISDREHLWRFSGGWCSLPVTTASPARAAVTMLPGPAHSVDDVRGVRPPVDF
jgi:hypothetical protein